MASVEAIRIALVDDEKMIAWDLTQALTPEGFEVASFGSVEEAEGPILERPPDLVVLDLNLPGRPGMELLEKIRANCPGTHVIILSGHGSIARAVEATKKGAFAFLTKPCDKDQLKIEIRNALDRKALQSEVTNLKARLSAKTGAALIGASKPMTDVSGRIRKIAPFDVSVLILGESGTGKEVVARMIHEGSPRAAFPFISVDCGALPDHLVESELFGYEKGAFTGAMLPKPGRFQMANKGTLFLDEIGNLPLSMQVKLLRVLQERTFTRLGGKAEEKVDIRVVAATNASLDLAIRQGKFREDLYHRLNQFKIPLPPLRERRGDLPLLTQHFVHEYAKEFGKTVDGVDEAAMTLLKSHAFPGNVRELQNVLRHAVVLCDGRISVDDLPEEFVLHARAGTGSFPVSPSLSPASSGEGDPLDLRAERDRTEKETIEKALAASAWHQENAAKILGITPKTLSTKLKQFGLRKPKA